MRSRSTSEPGRLWPVLALAGACAMAALPARADVWGYVDPKGTAHFASEPEDERYQLLYRGEGAYSSDELALRADTPRPVQVPTLQPRLLAFFEVSPGYKLVRRQLREAADAQRVDYELLQALIATESGFDNTAVSPRGAVGLMQVMPVTAERFGVVGDARTPVERKLADPRTNLRVGTLYLRHLMDLFNGRLELALAAYNAGEGAVLRAGSQVPNIIETRNYVRTVTQLYALLKPPAVLAEGQSLRRPPTRVRMELVPGAAAGRGQLHEPPNDRALNATTISELERNAIEFP